ncbi:MAG: acyltransferase family protein [Flavipsychrobacter sp.]
MQQPRYYPQLDGIRFICILLVLFEHWGIRELIHVHTGGAGVVIFFVLSGFLLGEILFLEKEKGLTKWNIIKNFFVRRTLRIFPLYYATILLYAVVMTTGGILWWNLLYANNILQAIDVNRVPKEFWPLWSLCVEEQFYLFFPFFMVSLSVNAIRKYLVVGVLFALVGRIVLISINNELFEISAYALMPFCLDCLFFGVLLAYYKLYKHDAITTFFRKYPINVFLVLFIALQVVLQHIGSTIYNNAIGRLFASITGVVLIGYSVLIGYKGWFQKVLENKFISYLGKVSYGLYLLHAFIQVFYEKYLVNNPVKLSLANLNLPIISNRYLIDFVFMFIITVAVAHISYQYFEKRFLKYKSKFV